MTTPTLARTADQDPASQPVAPGTAPAAAADTAADTEAGGRFLGLFAIPLGLAGLGGVWQALDGVVDAPAWPAETLFAVSAALWAAFTLTYVVTGVRARGRFTTDLRHTIYGPFAAYPPIIGILLAAHYEQHASTASRTAVVVFVVLLAVVAAQLLAHWLLGNVPVSTFHPGYFLPLAAGPFVASIGLSISGWHQAAEAAFGTGIFFSLSIGTLIFGRLFTGPQLPDVFKPALSVLVSPPATAGIAWSLLQGQPNGVTYALLGVLFLMLLVQVLFFAEYRHLSFTPNFWAFSFPVAASSNLAVRWISAEQFPYWRAWSWSLTGLATAFILALAAATILGRLRR